MSILPYLHDGRAETLSEAIEWHSGEAEECTQKYLQMSKAQRDLLFTFLNNLKSPLETEATH